MELDLSTPARALQILEHAYRTKDLDLALSCRNFLHEAELMLYHLGHDRSDVPTDASTVTLLSEVLQTRWRQAGPPNFDGITSTLGSVEHFVGKFYIATESGRYPDGAQFCQRLFMSFADGKWSVLCPAAAYERPTMRKWRWAFWR